MIYSGEFNGKKIVDDVTALAVAKFDDLNLRAKSVRFEVKFKERIKRTGALRRTYNVDTFVVELEGYCDGHSGLSGEHLVRPFAEVKSDCSSFTHDVHMAEPVVEAREVVMAMTSAGVSSIASSRPPKITTELHIDIAYYTSEWFLDSRINRQEHIQRLEYEKQVRGY